MWLLLKGVKKNIENETKEQNVWLISMLVGTSASIFWSSMLAGKEVKKQLQQVEECQNQFHDANGQIT